MTNPNNDPNHDPHQIGGPEGGFGGFSSGYTGGDPMHGGRPVKRLTRDVHDKMLGGVCSGLAHYVGIDPTLMRVLYLLVTVFTGVPVILYFVLWMVIPEN